MSNGLERLTDIEKEREFYCLFAFSVYFDSVYVLYVCESCF